MQTEELPKILSISIATWDQNSGNHTETDLFKYWSPERLAQIYTRSDLPNTPVCNRFFRISENQIIKSVYKRNPVGERVQNTTEVVSETEKRAIEAERKLYAKAHKKKSWFMTIMREIIWGLGRWKTKALDTFIEEENPDVYFVPIYPVVFMGKLQLHNFKETPSPVCLLSYRR